MLGDIDALIADAMAEWEVPALAITVVHGGEPLMQQAFGRRDVEAGLAATTDTQFAICSITKSFTASALGMLVDERKLDWDRPVRDYIAEFRLLDPVSTERLSARDMLTHRSGLPRHDWVWMPGHLDTEQMFAALRYLEPSKDFRTTFQYQNLMYTAAGILAERVSGVAYEDFVRSRLLAPLGMDRATFSVTDMARELDVAQPYAMVDDIRRKAPLYPISAIPAGGITASIAEMTSYLRFHLAFGVADGRRLLSQGSAQLMQSPQIHCFRSEFDEVADVHYGLGFQVGQYRGERMVSHGGGWVGWTTLISMLPGRGIGTVILTNRSAHPVCELLSYAVFDRLCGREPVAWLDRFRAAKAKWQAQRKDDRAVRSTVRKTGTQPSHLLADYAGDYEHPAYGRVSVALDGTALRWRGLGIDSELRHRHFDIFELPDEPADSIGAFIGLGVFSVAFAYNREGDIDRLSVPLEPLVADIMFRRLPDARLSERAFLEPFAATFEVGTMKAVVAIDADGQLTLSLPGQSTYHLEPLQGTKFSLRELKDFRVEFRQLASGEVDAVIFHQPNGTFIARRVEPGRP